jgi:hypothetical protein
LELPLKKKILTIAANSPRRIFMRMRQWIFCALAGMIPAQSVLAQTLRAGPGQIVDQTDLTIVTNGANGAESQGGTLTLRSSSVTTSGSGVGGLALLDDNNFPSLLTITNSTVTANGGAWGILIDTKTNKSQTNEITVDTTTVTTTDSDGIEVVKGPGNVNITFTNGSHVTPGNGVLLHSFANGQRDVNLTAQGNVILRGDVLVEGPSKVNVTLLDQSQLTGAMQEVNDVTVQTSSTWNMTNSSTANGNVLISNLGNLVFDSANKFASTGQASVLSIGGNYTMDSSSTLSLGVGGILGKQYDRLDAQGTANINNGTLKVNSLSNFRPSAGNVFEIVSAKNGRNGQFGQVNDFLNNNPNLQRVDIYAPNGVALTYVAAGPTPTPTPVPTPTPTPVPTPTPTPVPTPTPPPVPTPTPPPVPTPTPPPGPTPTPPPGPTPSPTPNPRPPIIEVIPDPLPPVDPDRSLFLSFLLKVLEPTASQLTALFEIPFSGANTQRFNLDNRFAEIQRGSTGFVSPLPTVPTTGKETVFQKDGKTVSQPPVFQPGPQNRWGVWVNGWGDFVNVDDDNFARGYHFTTGGGSVGIDYRITDSLAVGIFGSYAHTWTDLNPGDVDVNTGRGGLYATYWNKGLYINGAVYGGYNSYDTSRKQLVRGLANGSTSGYEFSTFLEAGYDFHFGNFTVGPVGSLQYTNVHVNGYSEEGSFLPINVHEDSEDSLRTDIGLQASLCLADWESSGDPNRASGLGARIPLLGFADNLQRSWFSGSYSDGLRTGRRP